MPHPTLSTTTLSSLEAGELASQRCYPSVSLLVDLDEQAGPWPARLAALRRLAERRLDVELGPDGEPALRSSLRSAVETAEPAAGAKALALFVSCDTATAVSLPVGVRDRVVIDETFATRDLVHAANRSPAYWLLALDLRRPRLLRGAGPLLQPVGLDLVDDVPESGGAGPGRRERRFVDDRRVRRFQRMRAVAGAVTSTIGDRDAPLVVVGVEPTVSHVAGLLESSRLAIVRRPPHGPAEDLAEAASVALARLETDRCADALSSLDRHVAAGRVVEGLTAAWRCAHEVGGAVLLVEAGFEQPAEVGDDGSLRPSDARDEPGVIDDAVDELIEAVLARGGMTHVLPDGSLQRMGRVALLTRHPVAPLASTGAHHG